MNFVNIHGQPIEGASWLKVQADAARLRRQLCIPEPRRPTVKNGYAAPPGSGPEGMRCADCTHKRSLGRSRGKHFIKCELRRSTWTKGEGTDILARSPACNKFEKKGAA